MEVEIKKEPAPPAEPAKPAAPPIVNSDEAAAEQRLRDFETGSVNPDIEREIEEEQQAEEELKKALEDEKPVERVGVHKFFADENVLAKWMVGLLSKGLVQFNVLIFNAIYSGKKRVIASEIELTDTELKMLRVACEDYAPQLMKLLDKLPGPLLAIAYMEMNIWARMQKNAHVIEKEPFKQAA